MVLNVGSEIVEANMKHGVGTKVLCERTTTCFTERSASKVAQAVNGEFPHIDVRELQVGFGIIAIIDACSERMRACAVVSIIDDLKLMCRASIRD